MSTAQPTVPSAPDDSGCAPRNVVEAQVRRRMGMLPNFFAAVSEVSSGPITGLWDFALSCYIENALPPLFKERLFVHLSRGCAKRYCVERHIGFLVGLGTVAGDPAVASESIDDVYDLLALPLAIDDAAIAPAIARLEALPRGSASPTPRSQAETDVFLVAARMFGEPGGSAAARAALTHALGDERMGSLIVLLAFITTAHFASLTHPSLEIEEDMSELIGRDPRLKALLDLPRAPARRAGT